jgi:starch-binding outer membrane protein, SusD/RagB family
MKKSTYIFTIVLLMLSTVSCNDDFLDVEPLDKFSDESLWKDLNLIEAFVNDIYGNIPHGHSNIMFSSATDESMYNADFGSSDITKSNIDPSNLGTLFNPAHWTANRFRLMSYELSYKNIRAANLFFENIDKTEFEDVAVRDRLKGEVHFLRAYIYHNLIFTHGGMPLITEAFDLDDDFNTPRSSFKECVDFIVSECDAAAALLPKKHDGTSDLGRATKGAALALKSRVLLYAASELYHNTSWAGAYPNPEFISYVGDRTALYQDAKAAAEAVIALNEYSLYKADQASDSASAVKNYSEIFLMKANTEDIFLRYFISKSTNNWDGYNPGLYNTPNGYHGWGSNTPTQQHVDAYEMNDGTPFDWNNPAHAQNPYRNRDPRFYATILYDGVKWRVRPVDVRDADPAGIIQTGTFEKWNSTTNTMVEVAGLDTRGGPIENWNGTYTGYYLRKFLDPELDAQFQVQESPWRFIRYTEVLLNYAEAAQALGFEVEARDVINDIRARVNMPPIADSGTALRDKIRHERRIELAFEDHRFFDIRRWMIAPDVITDAGGVDIRYGLLPDKTTSKQPTYELISVQDRQWLDKVYFLPIPLAELNRNNALVQNPLY